MNFPKKSLFATLATLLALTGCGDRREQPSADTEATPLEVYVVNYPLKYFAERMGGDQITVHFPAPPDIDPAEWNPDDETILRYQQADLIFLNGAGYAGWTDHVSLPTAALVNTARNIGDHLLIVPDAVTHSHGPEGSHSHAGTAFTTWLDPMLAIEHARVIKETLSQRIPSVRDEFDQRFQALADDFRALHREIKDIVSRNPDQPLLASHPVYQYLEAPYRLNLESLHWEPDEMPAAAEWEALDEILAHHPAQWMIWEDEPLPEIAARLAERGVGTLVYDPCSQPPSEGDLLSVMRQNAANLRLGF
jgi:zinc transport system substrate-binding protein